MRLTTKRIGKNVIPLLMAVCGINLPYWRVDRTDDLHSYLSGDAADKLAAYEDAEEQGLLVRMPCKAGDTVWTLNHHYRPVDGKVQSIHQNYVGDRAGRWVLTSFFPEYYGQAESGLDPDFIHATRYFGTEDFGKTVFHTREEAEAALKGETKDV